MKKLIFALIIVVMFVFTGCKAGSEENHQFDSFAQCLTEKGVSMYGAYWCPHCEQNKDAFFDAIEFVNYVECDPRGDNEQSELCLEKNIESYPSWEFPDGKIISGTLRLSELSDLTGCPLFGEKIDS